MKFINYIEKPISFCLLILSLVGIGVYCIFDLPVKMYPNMIKPGFKIWYGHKNVSLPLEIYKAYGKNIEEQIKGLKDLETYSTTYSQKNANITLEFAWNVDAEEIAEKLKNIFISVKSGDKKFWYNIQNKAAQSSGGMLVAVAHKAMVNQQLQDFLENKLTPQLRAVEGVENVNFWGSNYSHLAFALDQELLLNHNINLDQLIDIILSALSTKLAGEIGMMNSAENSYAIILPAIAKDSQELLDIIVFQDPNIGITLKLKDLGKITEIQNSSASIFHLNGLHANFMNINLLQIGDVKKSCDEVEHLLTKFQKEQPGLIYNILVNPAEFIQNAINNLLLNALIGGIVATFIIFLFLGAWQNTLIIGISIPFCIITSFILMKVFAVSINIISLGGMAIGVGMILDSSIVTLENIYRNLMQADRQLGATKKIRIILDSTKQVALPIISSILTSIVVFLPIIYTNSYTQAILGDLAKTVVFTLLISTFASLFIVPVLSFKFIALKKISNKKHLFDKINIFYLSILKKIIKSRTSALITLLISLLLFSASLLLIPKIKKEIIAVPTTKLFDIRFELPDNQSLALAKKYTERVEKFLASREEVKNYSTYLWRPANGYITAELYDRHQFKALKKIFDEKFPATPEAKLTAQQWDPGQMPLPRKTDLLVYVSGGTEKEMTTFTDAVMVQAPLLAANIRRSPWMSKSEGIKLKFHSFVDPAEISNIQKYVEISAKEGAYLTDILDDGKNRSLYLILQTQQRSVFINDLQNLPIPYKGKIIQLKALAEINISTENYIPIRRMDGKSLQTLYINFNEKNAQKKQALLQQTKATIKTIERPLNLFIEYPDPNKEINKSFDSFKFSLFISLFLVFTIITLLFNSIRYPLMIICTVPFAITGVVLGLYLAASTISLNSMLGTILLSGLVVNNAILFIDFYIRAKEMGQSNIDCIMQAASLRFRPILMTTLTTIFGVIPVALAIGESGEILQPLGIAILFGLLISTLLALILTPCFLKLFYAKDASIERTYQPTLQKS